MVIGSVIEGSITKGESVILKSQIKMKKQILHSSVFRIEVQKKEIDVASEGMSIGMCLPGVNVRDLRRIRKTKGMKLYSK